MLVRVAQEEEGSLSPWTVTMSSWIVKMSLWTVPLSSWIVTMSLWIVPSPPCMVLISPWIVPSVLREPHDDNDEGPSLPWLSCRAMVLPRRVRKEEEEEEDEDLSPL